MNLPTAHFAHLILPELQVNPSQKQKSRFLPTHPKIYAIFANIRQVNIKTMKSQFGERVRILREKQKLYLRQVAPLLEMDTAQLSKIEKGLRQLKREQISIIAEILKANSDELMTLWLADQIYAVVKDEKLANEAMQIAEKNINLKKKK